MFQRQVNEIKMHNKISVYLKNGMNKYTQIKWQFARGENERCALGAILSEQGWDGESPLEYAIQYNENNGVRFTTYLNDSGYSFEQIVDKLEGSGQ